MKPEATGKVGVSQVVRIGAPVALAADIRARYDNIAFGYSSLNTAVAGAIPELMFYFYSFDFEPLLEHHPAKYPGYFESRIFRVN